MPCAGRAPADGRKLLKLGRGRNGGFGGNRGLLKNCRCDGEMTAFARGGELCSQLSIIAKAEPHCGNTDKQGIGKKCKNCSAIGVDPTITIHEREDSANLLNLVRHELGLSGRLTAAVRRRH